MNRKYLANVVGVVRQVVSDVLGVEIDTVDLDASVLDLGVNSLSFAKIATRLNRVFGIDLVAPDLFASDLFVYPSGRFGRSSSELLLGG